MALTIKGLKETLIGGEPLPPGDWNLKVFSHEECLGYVAWNSKSNEFLVVDPRQDDQEAYISLVKSHPKAICIAIIDTHTHADHISGAAEVAKVLSAPLLMHELSPSKRVHLRITCKTFLSTHSGPIHFIPTPGHTEDGICVWWGPFLFTGDTVLFGDVGRDDLPGGDSNCHYESLQSLRNLIPSSTWILPGHDSKGGRISLWQTQLKVNSSLTQDRESFVRESNAFDAAAPALFKKSLVENFK